MKKLFKIFPLVTGLTAVFFINNSNLPYTKESNDSDSDNTVSLTFVGDLMCHSVQYNYARSDSGSFYFDPVFENVKHYLTESDYTFGNLETTISPDNSDLSGYPQFSSPHNYLGALKNSGFDYLFTSNNHSYDRGKKGVLNTLESIRKYGMIAVGTNESESQKDSNITFTKKGIKYGLLSYTEHINGFLLKKGDKYLVNLIDTNRIKKDIARHKSGGTEVVIVYLHFGEEYKKEPNKYQISIVNKLIKMGADIIIGSHPHVLQRTEFVSKKAGSLDSGFVAYSLGNFISNQQWRYSDSGVILKLGITKNPETNRISINKFETIPTYVFKNNTKQYFKILPLNESGNYTFEIPDTTILRQSYNDSKKILHQVNN